MGGGLEVRFQAGPSGTSLRFSLEQFLLVMRGQHLGVVTPQDHSLAGS